MSMRMKMKAGFSLIEVNLAILVVAGGLLQLFSLFPAGLRMSTSAMSDTRQSLFANDFFTLFEAGVSECEKAEWEDIDKFWKAAKDELDNISGFSADSGNWTGDKDVRDDWECDNGDFKKTLNNSSMRMAFYHGTAQNYFSTSTDAGGSTVNAEFLLRISSDSGIKDQSGQNRFDKYQDRYDEYYWKRDPLVWRVSLVVNDSADGSWYYDNPVYHRDFRFHATPFDK